jgi:hypothetical protein
MAGELAHGGGRQAKRKSDELESREPYRCDGGFWRGHADILSAASGNSKLIWSDQKFERRIIRV